MTTIPTIASLKASIKSNFESEFGIVLNPYGLAFLIALQSVLAALAWLIYLAIALTQQNIWVDTCDAATLLRYGLIILGRYPFGATTGQYTVTVTGTVGAIIPATTVFKSDDSSESPGMLFQIAVTYVMPGSTGSILLNALNGGLSSRLQVGDTLTATAPIINVNSGATVASEDIVPIDAETIEQYRAKVIEKIQLEPGSWSAVDYRLVGISVAGVREIYAYADSGHSAEVNVFVQGTVPVPNPGPSASPTVVGNYRVELQAVLPLSVWLVNYASCPINNIDIAITMGAFPAFTTAQKALIESALTTLVNSVHPFIAAADDISLRNDVIATFNLTSTVTNAVPGYGFSSIAFTVGGVPQTSWTADNGNISYMNSIVYI